MNDREVRHEHRWEYWVERKSGDIRGRRCRDCGARVTIERQDAATPAKKRDKVAV